MYFKYILFILCIKAVFCDNSILYRFCVNEERAKGSACQAVQKGNSQVACILAIDSVDCALKIQRGDADFGLFSAEDALVASKFINEDVRVVGQLRNSEWINETFAFQSVVVVRNEFNGGFSQLRSKDYCHPGFRSATVWSDRVLKEFEKAVIPRECLTEYPNVHQETFSIARFFKSACRPGHWAYDDSNDKKLKKKFPSLCELCDLPGKCLYKDEFEGSHVAALICLAEGDGDVTYVSLDYAQEFFGLTPGSKAKANQTEFKFLCPNGNTQPLNKPCPWVRQPWPVLIASKDKAPLLTQLIPNFICASPECRRSWKEAFTFLLEGHSDTFIRNAYGDRTMNDYLREGRVTPKEWEGDACRRSVRLCTVNKDEYEKCEWLKQAVIAQDFEPRLSCVQSKNKWSCFDLINKRQADIVGIDTDYSFIARRVYGLTAVAYQDNTYDGNYFIVAIIKKTAKNIKSLSDLKARKACFPEYGGLAWHSFISVAKKSGILPKVCPHVKAVTEFFSSICAPGATDRDHKDYNISIPANLCSLCAKRINSSKDDCEATTNNKYYGDIGAFSCLGNNAVGVADVAFLNYRTLVSKESDDFMAIINKDDYRILCRDGTLKELVDYSQLDENCVLSVGVGGEIVTRQLNTKPETRDIEELLLRMGNKFGEDLWHYDNIIRMYRPFNDKKGLIFKDTTVDIVSVHHDLANSSINYFTDLLESVPECIPEADPPKKKNKSNKLGSSNLVLLTFTSILFALYFVVLI